MLIMVSNLNLEYLNELFHTHSVLNGLISAQIYPHQRSVIHGSFEHEAVIPGFAYTA